MKQFGETIRGYNIPVLNEREIRAAAGILFFFAFLSILTAILISSFLLLKYFVIAFLIDFIIRLFLGPRYSPTLIIGRWIVNKQTPEYVGAAQKKFAWVIGLVLAVVMFGLIVLLNSYSVITGLICLVCLVFLLFESAFGICLGCLFYKWFYKEKAQYCPGEICEVKDRHAIQKTSFMHLLIVIGFIGFIVVAVFLFNDNFSQKPSDLWEILSSAL